MRDYNFLFRRSELILLFSALCIYNFTFCATNTTTPDVTTYTIVTTLASDLNLVDSSKVYIIAGAILTGIPISILFCCAVRSIKQHRREKKITDDDDLDFQHPPPSHPAPRPFLQRDNTIAGPFMNPAFGHNDDDGADDRSRVVTPSFVSTQIVNEPMQRYQYIP